MKSKLTKIGYELSDVEIVQAPISYIDHRKEINYHINGKVCGRVNMLPIFAAPMESVIDENNYKVFIEYGITPVIPRTVQQRIDINKRIEMAFETFVAFSLEEAENVFLKNIDNELVERVKNQEIYVCIDMAQGTMVRMYFICKQIKQKYGKNFIIMSGNICTPKAYPYYVENGIDYMRVCVGSGSRCVTSNAVGVHMGTATLVDELYGIKEQYDYVHRNNNILCKETTKLIVDGGIDWYDKITKSLALGGDFVMIGKLFAECEEACGKMVWLPEGMEVKPENMKTEEAKNILQVNMKPYRMYRGMSHRSVQKEMGGDGSKVSEGICAYVEVKYTLEHFLTNVVSYLTSAMSYTNSKTLYNFKDSEFIIRGSAGEAVYKK